MSGAMPRPLDNSYWVFPQSLLAGEYPGGRSPAETESRLNSLYQAGIDSFIDLTEVGERQPYQHLLTSSCEYLRAPIIDSHVPLNVAETVSVLAAIRGGLSRGKRVYVHCQAGIGRTGLVIGCYLAEIESNGKTALKALNRLWLQSERAKSWSRVPQTSEQADYVRNWPKLARLRG